MIRFFLLIILLLISSFPAFSISGYEQTVKLPYGVSLTYSDLIKLSETQFPEGGLKEKLYRQLNIPIVHQLQEEVNFSKNNKLSNFFRVASWNIERGFNVDSIEKVFLLGKALNDPLTQIQDEISALSKADIIIINEADIGLPRTNYENIPERLSNLLKMGYVFGTEFIEVDPYQLGVKKFTREERVYLDEKALKQLDKIDPLRFYGLHGSCILTRYLIRRAKIVRLPDCYNWYLEESKKLSVLEFARRETAEKIFSSKILNELRHGGRMAIVIDLELPNSQIITVVATHLENRCLPECRVRQLQFLLNGLKNIRNPLILAGDFNTTGTDVSPTSVKKEVLKKVKDPGFIAKQAILSLTPVTLVQNLILNTTNALRKFQDPTTKNIPIFLPNKERKLFDLIKEFRFIDGNSFDFRGTVGKTYGGYESFLSNSNERGLKGFIPTFELERHFGVAKYKLDWFFVKPLNLNNPRDEKGSYAYAPYFGRTLQLVNKAYGEKISDHDPIIVNIFVPPTSLLYQPSMP